MCDSVEHDICTLDIKADAIVSDSEFPLTLAHPDTLKLPPDLVRIGGKLGRESAKDSILNLGIQRLQVSLKPSRGDSSVVTSGHLFPDREASFVLLPR